ncbi:hypothetical protein J3459_015946 [Metarhizium acridum]|nr:hypothetical protein J3459_015946 [Metarhizium acridum]
MDMDVAINLMRSPDFSTLGIVAVVALFTAARLAKRYWVAFHLAFELLHLPVSSRH